MIRGLPALAVARVWPEGQSGLPESVSLALTKRNADSGDDNKLASWADWLKTSSYTKMIHLLLL